MIETPAAHAMSNRAGTDDADFVAAADALIAAGRTAEAIKLLEEGLPRCPDLRGHIALGPALLTEGRFVDGWAQCEFRWFAEPYASARPHYGKPQWDGQDLTGKTILLCPDQGFGDIFQMIRYAPMLKARGATVLLLPIRELGAFIDCLPGIDDVIEVGAPLPDFDFWIPLMSLPRAFGTTAQTIPAVVPYLFPPEQQARRWSSRIPHDGKLNVGIAWTGSAGQAVNARRSIQLAQLLPVLRVEGARFHSLQKGPGAEAAEGDLKGADLVNLGPELSDFGDTAAAIAEMDLVISICTSVAHLAGAMGKPVWLLLSDPCDYRWLKDREDSPWYPTMRLFRQRRPGDWTGVVASVAGALAVMAGGQRPPAHPITPAILERSPEPRPPAGSSDAAATAALAIAAETRTGLMQFVPDDGIQGRSIRRYGEHLQTVMDYLLRFIRTGMTVVEVGAGYGAHSIQLSAALGAGGHLHLMERDPIRFMMLSHNCAANGARDAAVYCQGLGDRMGSHSGAARTQPAVRPLRGDERAATSLDSLSLPRLDWLKINAGVDAAAVLNGGSDALWQLRPNILALQWDAESAEATLRRLKEFGYRCWRRNVACFDSRNFNRRTDDIFNGRTAVELLAFPEETEVALNQHAGVES